jgi:hypothetical protein
MSESELWVLSLDAVRASIRDLRAVRSHPFFVAYLHLRQCAANEGRTDALKPNWTGGLGPYLEVAGAPPKHPYYRPFWDGAAQAGQEWLNSNLAGSFAPSSLRASSPPFLVVDYDRDTKRFALREGHWELARTHLLRGEQLPAEALAAFFLRDFGFYTTGEPPSVEDLVGLFAAEFGYRGQDSMHEFQHLYQRVGSADGLGDSWFEPYSTNNGVEQ